MSTRIDICYMSRERGEGRKGLKDKTEQVKVSIPNLSHIVFTSESALFSPWLSPENVKLPNHYTSFLYVNLFQTMNLTANTFSFLVYLTKSLSSGSLKNPIIIMMTSLSKYVPQSLLFS